MQKEIAVEYDDLIEPLTDIETQINQVGTSLQMLRSENMEQGEMEGMLEPAVSRMEDLLGI